MFLYEMVIAREDDERQLLKYLWLNLALASRKKSFQIFFWNSEDIVSDWSFSWYENLVFSLGVFPQQQSRLMKNFNVVFPLWQLNWTVKCSSHIFGPFLYLPFFDNNFWSGPHFCKLYFVHVLLQHGRILVLALSLVP